MTALEVHEPFVRIMASRFGSDVRALHGSMGPDPGFDGSAPIDLGAEGPFDLIWCAGAIYFVGVAAALRHWRRALAPGGAVAFSAPALFTATPSEGARAFWEGEPVQSTAQVRDDVAAAGYRIVVERKLPDASWEAYFGLQAERIAALREAIRAGREADAMAAVLDTAEREAALWRGHREEVGYLAIVARPDRA